MCPALRATGRQGHLRLGYRGPRPARSVDIPLPSRGAPSAPARCDLQTPGPGRHRRTPRTRITRAGARATARSAEVMRDTAGAVSRAPTSPSTSTVGRHPHADPGARRAPGVRPRDTAPAVSRMCPPLRATGRHLRLGYRGPPTGLVSRHPVAESRRAFGTRSMRSSNPEAWQAPPNAPHARHASRCAATARSAEVMRDTAGAVSRAPLSVGIPTPIQVPAGHPALRSAVTPGVGRRLRGRGGKGLPPYGRVGLKPVSTNVPFVSEP
jgi:hypothetical protein